MELYNQEFLVNRLNDYLAYENRPLKLKHGYCHGLSLLWLHYMSIGQEGQFYGIIRNIISAENKNDFDKIKSSVEKFLSHIEWLQHSDNYASDIHQSDVDKLLEVTYKKSICFLFTRTQLDEILTTMIPDQTMVCVSSVNHSIGIFRRGDRYHLFDPNYEKGDASTFGSLDELKDEIIRCFYDTNADMASTFPLSFTIASNINVEYPDSGYLLKKLVHGNSHVNDASYGGFTNLYFASRDGNTEEVKELLSQNADPNYACMDSWTPLLAAASKGYYTISKELISHGADVNYVNKEKHNALFLCVDNGYSDVAELLLTHGADPFLTNKQGQTPIYAALRNQDWHTAAILLNYVNNLNSIFNQDKEILLQHKNEMTSAFNNIAKHASCDYSKHILHVSHSLFKPGLLYRLFSFKLYCPERKNSTASNTKTPANSPSLTTINSKKTVG